MQFKSNESWRYAVSNATGLALLGHDDHAALEVISEPRLTPDGGVANLFKI